MGDYNFSYELPNNFAKRVQQFLHQMKADNMADAFTKCHYEYEDVGFAYYAGLKGDNWNKNAIDVTFEGSTQNINCLSSRKAILKNALDKAIKPSESGFLVRELYFVEEDIENLPETNEDRLNADIKIAKEVLHDLLQIAERACLNPLLNASSTEDSINDYFRDMLAAKGYKEVKDQTRHGISVNKNNAGEVDILLTKDGKEIAIYEGMKLDSVNKNYIATHINKAIINYNALGIATFIVAYVNSGDFGSFWNRYYEYLTVYTFPLKIKKFLMESTYPNASTRIASMILSRDGYDFPVYFITIKIA